MVRLLAYFSRQMTDGKVYYGNWKLDVDSQEKQWYSMNSLELCGKWKLGNIERTWSLWNLLRLNKPISASMDGYSSIGAASSACPRALQDGRPKMFVLMGLQGRHKTLPLRIASSPRIIYGAGALSGLSGAFSISVLTSTSSTLARRVNVSTVITV